MTDALMPGADPGACPDCGRWRKAGLLHECEVVTAPEQSATAHAAVVREILDERGNGDRTPEDYDRADAALDALVAELERAEKELRYMEDRGDHLIYRDEWEAFDKWQRTKDTP